MKITVGVTKSSITW